MNPTVQEMTNLPSRRGGPINQDSIPCPQRYVVHGFERMRKRLILKRNNIALQIIGGTRRERPDCLGRTAMLCPKNHFPSEQSDSWWRKNKS
jgi:hypothetical protein